MADTNNTDHLVRPEKDTLVNGYDNEGFHSHNRSVEDGEDSPSDEERLRVAVTTPVHGSHPESVVPNGHESNNGHSVNGTAVVLDNAEHDMDHHSNNKAQQQQKPLDTRLHHYVPAEDMDKKILNGSDGGTHVSIPEDAVISFSSGRVRVKKGAPSSSPQSPRDHRESIPLETLPPSYAGGGEKAELEAELSNHKNGVWSSEGHNYGSAESHFISEKLNGTSKSSDEVSLPVNNHRKCLRGEKLYFTEESRKLCPGWRRLLICGLILIMIAIALLLGVLAATGILLSKSDSKNTRYESGHSLPNMDSIAHAGHSFRPKPSSKVPQKFQPPVTVEAELFPNATPSATFDVGDTVSQAPSTVTSKVPPFQNDSSHSQTIVPNALVGEFKIIDENFTDDLNDHSSRGYRNLAGRLETELHRIFKDSGGRFDELKVLNFRPGSIRVKFVVIWSSDQGIISSTRATEILSADLRKKNNSFYNFIFVDMNSIRFIDVFDECRIQKGGCSFDCVWNYDTLLKTCICSNDMYLLSDGKSCSPKPITSYTSSSTTSTTSPQPQPTSQSMSTFAGTEPTTEISKPQEEHQPTLYPFPDVLVTTTPKSTEFYPTEESPTTETYFKDNLDTKQELTTTEAPITYPQTFPVEVIDDVTTTPSSKESSYGPGGMVGVFPETTTTAETTLLSEDDKTGRQQPAFTTESVTTVDGITAQTTPSSFREWTGNTGTYPTAARETVYPYYDTTWKYYPSTYYPANVRTDTPSEAHTESSPRGSTINYHIPEPTTEVYTWSPHHDYPTEYFNPDAPSTDYIGSTKPEQETTFPLTYDEGMVAGESGSETTTESTTSTSNIKREGTWQENQTLPTTFGGNVWKDQTELTTVKDETHYETTYFPQVGGMAESNTTTDLTTKRDETTTTNPYVHSSFPLFVPYYNRTPGVRSYDNFTDYYDNATFVTDHEDYGAETTVSETPTEKSSWTGYFPPYSSNASSTWYGPATETTYSGNQFAGTTTMNSKPLNFSEESSPVGSSSNFSPGVTTPQYGLFNATETVESEVTGETPNSTFPLFIPDYNRTPESNMTFPLKATTDSHLTETPLYNYDRTNWTNSGNFNLPAESNTETPQYNFPTTVSDGLETAGETFNPTFETESTAQFPSKAVTESYYPKEETTLYNYDRSNWTTESFSSPRGYNTETAQGNITTFPIGSGETETTFQPETTTIVGPEMGTRSTIQYEPKPVYTEPYFPYASSNATYETETTAVADSETTFHMEGNDTSTAEQSETVTSFLIDKNATQTPFTGDFPVNPVTDYPLKSAKSETGSTSFYGWPETAPNTEKTASYGWSETPPNAERTPYYGWTETAPNAERTPYYGWTETAPNTERTTFYPDYKFPIGTSAVPIESVNTQMDTATEATTRAAGFETETTTPFPTRLASQDIKESADPTIVVTESPVLSSPNNTESDFAEMIPFVTTPPTTNHEGEMDYTTTPYEETIPTTYGSSPAFVETETSTEPLPETYQPMIPVSGNSFLSNDTRVVTEQSSIVTSKILSTDSSFGSETDMVTPAYTEFQSLSNSTDTSNTTLILSETSHNSTVSYGNSETTITYPDGTLPTMRFSNESEQLSTQDVNSTLIAPLSSFDSNNTDITGLPYDIDAETTLAPYAYEDTTIMADAESNLNETSYINRTDGNSTDEFSAYYPENFNSTDGNSTGIDENANVTTTTGYDMLNETTTNASIGIVCRDDQFICEPLNVCLNYTFMCDGIQDCPDGIDEADCQGTCHTNFKCSNSSNMCIMSEAQCDGIWDCENGTDEEFCKPSECAKHEVMCSDQSKCIRPSDICDLKYDCKDRSDEVGCVERTTCESGGKFFCNDGLCIPWSLKCDGEYDCKDREDEGNCTCYADEFQCNDGKCLKSSSRCDGHKDCHDGDDEMGCVNVDAQHLVMTYEPYSGTWAMLCAEDWSLDDGHYLCQELGFGHALKTEKLHVSFNGTWMAMRRENLTDASLWTERVSFVESCTSSLAASVECQKFACGEYSGLLHRRKREIPRSRRKRQALGSSSSSSSQWPFVGYTSTFYSSKGCLSEILTPIWLITSADCLLSISKEPFNGSDWYVRTNIGRSVEAGSVQNHEVLRMISHPHSSKFRSLTIRDYDVALIRLKHALVFVSDKIGAICPPEEQVPPGITCFSGGLGTQTPRAPPPTTLTINSLALQIIDRKNCNSVDHYNNLINQRMMCTQSSEGHTICDNDEGTPLMCLSGINKWFLAGMLSYQRYCEVYSKHPAVFSNLFSMRKFIDQVTGQKQYEIPYDSNVYMIIPPTTPSPTIPETTTIMYTTTEALSTTETTTSEFSTPISVLNYGMTDNGTTYETAEDTTLMANFTETDTTPLEVFEYTTLPEEFVDEMRSEGNNTTLIPGPFMEGNTTEATVRYPETAYTPTETFTPGYSQNGEMGNLNLTTNLTTGAQDITPIPLFGKEENYTDTTIPESDIVTLQSETRFDSDNSSELEPKTFETVFNASDMVEKTHDSMVVAQPNETYPVNTYIPYFLSGNATESYDLKTTAPTDEMTTTVQSEIPDTTLFPTEYATDYDIFNSSMGSLTRMPVMSMANETVDSVIGPGPERLTLTTLSEQEGDTEITATGEGNTTVRSMTETFSNITGSEASSVDLTTTENPDRMKETLVTSYKDTVTETDSRTFGVTEQPHSYTDASTLREDLKETETVGYTENPLMMEEITTTAFNMEEITTTASNMEETATEPVFAMEGRAETFQIPKAATPKDLIMKETTPTDFNVKETVPTDSNLKETTLNFSLKETPPTDLNLNETSTSDFTLKETIPIDLKETTPDFNSKETTTEPSSRSELTKAYMMKDTTTVDLGLKETEAPYRMDETTTPTPGWSEAATESEMKVDGLTENPHFNSETTTSAPGNTTPSSETRTLMFETEVGTDGDLALIAFNDSDGIVLQPAESPDGLSIVESMANSTDYVHRSRMLDEPARPSDLLYDTVQPNTDYVTTPSIPGVTDSITTEWEDYYTTLTTPKSVDETQDLMTTTEAVHINSSVVTTPSYQLLKEDTETTPNLQTIWNLTETTPNLETTWNLTETTPNPQTTWNLTETTLPMEYNITEKEIYSSSGRDECGTWDHPRKQETNDTKFFEEWSALGYLQLVSNTRMCAASLLSENFVVTSLNCLSIRDNQLKPDNWAYVGGLYNRDPAIKSWQTQIVAEIIPFANSSSSLLFHENNLALVRIKHRVDMNNNSQSACLPEKDIQPNQQCYTTGWSQVPTGREEGKRFYSVPVNIVPQDECNSTSNYNGLLLDSLICASYSNESFPTCQMDLGSPLFCRNSHNQWELQGVLNFPNPCDMVQPAVYNSVSNVQQWIQDTMLEYKRRDA